jgi:hypothetical protein
MASIPPPPSDPSSASTASTNEPLPSFEVASPPAAGEAAPLPTAGLAAPASAGPTALPSMPPPAPRRHTAELPPVPRLDDSAIASARTLPPMSDTNRPTLPPARRRSLLESTLAQLRRYEDSARKYLPPDLRKKVEKVPRGALLGASLGAGLCLIGAVTVTGLATYRALGSPPEAAATTSRSEPAARSAAQPASAAGPNAEAARAEAAPASVSKTAAPAPKSDEATVLLELADSLIAQRREADVIPILERLITRQPELKDDPRVARILMTTAAVEERRAATGSYTLLTGVMGESGAALMYELSQKRDVREGVRRRAATWLDSKEFERVAPLTVYAAVRLRKAETCEEKHALLDFAGKAGGKYVLAYLQELDRKKLCAADDLVNCYPCMRNDGLLGDTIAKIERSTAP